MKITSDSEFIDKTISGNNNVFPQFIVPPPEMSLGAIDYVHIN